ncbi:uncharacterized protein Tco_1244684 [Tanacetum coccineum]
MTWIHQEMDRLASHGIDLISMMHKKIGNGSNTSFWKDRWRGEQRLKEVFPRIYALEVNKHISVAFKFEQTYLSSSLRRMPRSGIESEQWDHLLDSFGGIDVYGGFHLGFRNKKILALFQSSKRMIFDDLEFSSSFGVVIDVKLRLEIYAACRGNPQLGPLNPRLEELVADSPPAESNVNGRNSEHPHTQRTHTTGSVHTSRSAALVEELRKEMKKKDAEMAEMRKAMIDASLMDSQKTAVETELETEAESMPMNHGKTEIEGVGQGSLSTHKMFMDCKPPFFKGVKYDVLLLDGEAMEWWATINVNVIGAVRRQVTWEMFVDKINERFCNAFAGRLCPDEDTMIQRYVSGLPYEYKVHVRKKRTFAEAMDEARRIEDDLTDREKNVVKVLEKRKWEGSSGSSNKKNKTGSEKKDDNKGKPKFCTACHSSHRGPCTKDTRLGELETEAESMPRNHGKTEIEDVGQGSLSTHKMFMDCKPPFFKGGDDSLVCKRWVRKITQIIEAGNYTDRQKVKYAVLLLDGEAMEWWATINVNVIGAVRTKEKIQFAGRLCPDEDTMIQRYVSGLPYEYKVHVRKKRTFAEAMDEARRIEDDLTDREKNVVKVPEKRKWEGSSGSSNKKNKTGSEKKDDNKGKPKFCTTCHSSHRGPCTEDTVSCRRCGKMGHKYQDLKSKQPICYKCQKMGHLAAACTEEKKKDDATAKKDASKATSRTFKMTTEEARQSDELIFGTFLINSMPAKVLFDSGASRSIVSSAFCTKFVIPQKPLEHALEIDVAVRKPIIVLEKFDNCKIEIDGNTFSLTLIPMGVGGFDVVIGMDWMKENRADILCVKKIVHVPLLSGGHAIAYGERCPRNVAVISVLKARKCLAKGCCAFLAHVVDSTKKKIELADVEVVRDYPDVFLIDLPGLPPTRGVEFQIDLFPGVAHVVKAPYRLAPSEMKEIMSQLQELLDKGFIRPSSSP